MVDMLFDRNNFVQWRWHQLVARSKSHVDLSMCFSRIHLLSHFVPVRSIAKNRRTEKREKRRSIPGSRAPSFSQLLRAVRAGQTSKVAVMS